MNNDNYNDKGNVCVLLLMLFSIAIVVSLIHYHSLNRSYESSLATYEHDMKYGNKSWLIEIERSRNIDMAICYCSGIGMALCVTILYSSKKRKNKMISKSKDSCDTTEKIDAQDTQSKLTELKSLYDSQLITEEEYNQKRKELIDKI